MVSMPLAFGEKILFSSNSMQTGFAIIIVLGFARILFSMSGSTILRIEADRHVTELRNRAFRCLINCPIEYFVNKRNGDIVSVIINDINAVYGFVVSAFPNIISNIIKLVFIIMILGIADWRGLICGVIVCILLLIAQYSINNINERWARENEINRAKVNAIAVEYIDKIKVVKEVGAEEDVLNKNREANQILHQAFARINKFNYVISISFNIGISVLLVGCICVGNMLWENDDFHFRNTFLLLVYSMQLISVFQNLMGEIQEYKKTRGELFRLTELFTLNYIDEINGVVDVQEGIIVDKVSYAFGKKEVLSKISLRVNSGELVSIIGNTGSGKSTLLNLITGILRPSSGNIYIPGIANGQSRSDVVAIVSQENGVISGTILDNLVWGLKKIPTKELISRVIQTTCLDDICDVETCANINVGESGKLLSAGQRQRICIARALLKETPFLLLDEATSNLGAEMEERIYRNIKTDNPTLGILSVTHRQSTLKMSDRIYKLEKKTLQVM